MNAVIHVFDLAQLALHWMPFLTFTAQSGLEAALEIHICDPLLAGLFLDYVIAQIGIAPDICGTHGK